MSTKTLWIRLDVEGRALKADVADSNGSTRGRPLLQWKGTDADLVELIYGLRGVNLIEAHGRPVEIKELADAIGGLFGRQLGKIYYTRMMNQRRKKDKTPFLNRMIRAILGSAPRD